MRRSFFVKNRIEFGLLLAPPLGAFFLTCLSQLGPSTPNNDSDFLWRFGALALLVYPFAYFIGLPIHLKIRKKRSDLTPYVLWAFVAMLPLAPFLTLLFSYLSREGTLVIPALLTGPIIAIAFWSISVRPLKNEARSSQDGCSGEADRLSPATSSGRSPFPRR